MTEGLWSPPPRPTWLIEVNRIAKGQGAVAGSSVLFDVNSLHAEASRNRGGLDDFGREDYLPALLQLTRSLEQEADLHHGGALVTRDEIVNTLECRLWVEDVHRRFPEAAQQDLGQIVFIGGPGRSGTSIAHEALAATPDAQFVTPWELRAPWIHELPEAQREQAKDEAYQHVAFSWYGLSPSLEVQHQMWRDMPQECAWAMNQQFHTDYFSTTFYSVPTFRNWLQGKSMVPTYRQYKRFLQALQWVRGKSEKVWVLKTPQHCFCAEAIFEIFPEAHFVWMHRDPIKVLGSAINFRRDLAWSRSDKLTDYVAISQFELQMIPAFNDWIIDYHQKMPKSRLSPVVYSDLIRNPTEALMQVLDNFDLRRDAEVRQSIMDYMASRPQHVKGKHDYSYRALGIADIEAAYKPMEKYLEHFGIKREW